MRQTIAPKFVGISWPWEQDCRAGKWNILPVRKEPDTTAVACTPIDAGLDVDFETIVLFVIMRIDRAVILHPLC